ncbi:YbhB/YbcL family Raf kinase inhibitor-like protein [Methylobacterium oryzihabitans]|uniref:YbhB/YbcL family Raf kinase inhibitor-like protein n=1 Tax=Methylobacterium oryzihabitans TaxID=2499852 RepID=A0A437PAL8_9HYPH|nr:YbhB/YbcL family Raf kinase inhibitor-like protein [Methylobacterium oryzihabitans]RVU19314.1 YbhB/YbcL family Raf kinase inhibitor-like protein [Methylobacterium oryzihabitans]
MLEKLPHAVGAALSGVKAGLDRTAWHAEFATVPGGLALTSPAFADGAAIPARFTADGPGLSPPLAWSGVPAGTAALALLVEDADSPTPKPVVHAIAWHVDPGRAGLDEGELAPDAPDAPDLGRNTYLRAGWLPPDPPTGHGPHRYLFQLYALKAPLDLDGTPGRTAFLDGVRAGAIARGLLTGTYERP